MMRLSPLDYRGMILGIPGVPLVVLNPYPLSLNPLRAPNYGSFAKGFDLTEARTGGSHGDELNEEGTGDSVLVLGFSNC